MVVAFVGLPSFSRERPTPPPPIAIEFVKIAEKTQVVAPKEEPETQEETAQAQPQQPNYAREEATQQAAAEAVPMPDAKPTPKEVTPKPQPKPEVSERQKLVSSVTPQSKPKAPSRLKSSRIAALLDRSMKEEQEQAPEAEEEQEEKFEQKEAEKKPDLLAGLRGKIATASMMDALRQKVEQNWVFPRGAKGIETMQVTIRIWLRPDGSLARQPEFVDAGDLNDPSRSYFRVFAESARRAVQLSAPFPEVMPFLTDGQRYIDFVFNPGEFAGG